MEARASHFKRRRWKSWRWEQEGADVQFVIEGSTLFGVPLSYHLHQERASE